MRFLDISASRLASIPTFPPPVPWLIRRPCTLFLALSLFRHNSLAPSDHSPRPNHPQIAREIPARPQIADSRLKPISRPGSNHHHPAPTATATGYGLESTLPHDISRSRASRILENRGPERSLLPLTLGVIYDLWAQFMSYTPLQYGRGVAHAHSHPEFSPCWQTLPTSSAPALQSPALRPPIFRIYQGRGAAPP